MCGGSQFVHWGFRVLTAERKQKIGSLAEQAWVLWNNVHDGRSWKRLWEGWEGSFTTLEVLLLYWERQVGWRGGKHK